ncbi:DUF5677 domain-containing protein [Pseudarthrobacter sp. B907]|uniref:DUF5677 domain-containing protein n=1 Tax=Pseudarthrobacter sp. B907 TaxID=3158261 RepID=UPI0032DA5AD4
MEKTRAKAFRRLFWDMKATWRSGPEPTPAPFGDGGRDAFTEWTVSAVAWGWTARVARSGEGAIRLAEMELAEEVAPLLRSAVEHSMWLWWLQADRGKVIEVLRRRQGESLEKIKKAQSVGWSLDAPTLETIEALIREANKQHTELDTYGNLAHMARLFKDDIGNLYPAWLYDTQTSHATLQSASAYYSPIPEGESRGPGFRLRHTPETVDNTAAKAAVAFHVALSGYSRVVGLTDYFQPKLDGFGQRFGRLSA